MKPVSKEDKAVAVRASSREEMKQRLRPLSKDVEAAATKAVDVAQPVRRELGPGLLYKERIKRVIL